MFKIAVFGDTDFLCTIKDDNEVKLS